MNAHFALSAVNFFMADVGGGLGPFLSTFLAEVAHWSPERIGWVVAGGQVAGAALATPAGSLVDRLGMPRVMLGAACVAILVGTVIMLPLHAFWPVLIAQVVVSAGGALGAPSISGLTLAVVGKAGYPRQQGTNEASNHAGNVTAAGLIALLSLALGSWTFAGLEIGKYAAVLVLAVMASLTLVALCAMDGSAVDGDRMRGRKKRQRGEKRGMTRALLRDRRLYLVLAVVGLFQLGNSAMLPLLGQRIVHQGDGNATAWMSWCVIAASLTMIPTALLAGHSADRFGRRWMLIAAFALVIARCLLAMAAFGRYWLIPIEVLDGLCAATFSVTMPLVVADLTYGGGRTQTAMGSMATVQAGGAALASLGWGYAVSTIGYTASFGAMAIFPAIAIALLMTVAFTDEAAGDQAAGDQAASGKAAAMSAAA